MRISYHYRLLGETLEEKDWKAPQCMYCPSALPTPNATPTYLVGKEYYGYNFGWKLHTANRYVRSPTKCLFLLVATLTWKSLEVIFCSAPAQFLGKGRSEVSTTRLVFKNELVHLNAREQVNSA